jgi:hypothetical protein
MNRQKGVALVLSLLLVLLLTLFVFALLLLSAAYYSSTRNFFRIQDCRLACESALKRILDRHNVGGEEPKFFFNPASWEGRKLAPFIWNGYTISGELKKDWSSLDANRFTLSARKGMFLAAQEVDVRQLRLEDFALYTDHGQTLSALSLLDGRVVAREGMELLTPGVTFRDLVQGDVSPSENAEFRRTSLQQFDYPLLADILSASLFREDAKTDGLLIRERDGSPFWRSDHYEMDLDRLRIDRAGRDWRITYGTADLGKVTFPHLWFEGPLSIRQTPAAIDFLRTASVREPLCIGSSGHVSIQSSLQQLVQEGSCFPLCIVSAETISTSRRAPLNLRVQACLVALGSRDDFGARVGVVIEPGGAATSESEKQALRREILTSVLLLEEPKRTMFLQAIDSGVRTVWLRGSVLSVWPLLAPDAAEILFEASRADFPLLPSLPFIRVVEGSRAWR